MTNPRDHHVTSNSIAIFFILFSFPLIHPSGLVFGTLYFVEKNAHSLPCFDIDVLDGGHDFTGRSIFTSCLTYFYLSADHLKFKNNLRQERGVRKLESAITFYLARIPVYEKCTKETLWQSMSTSRSFL